MQTSLTLPRKLIYGVGAISDAMKSAAFGLFLLFYYTSVRGVSGASVGLILSLSLIWDAVIDPVIGRISDRLPPRRRRHIPMLLGSLVMGLAFFAIFSPPAGMSQTGLLLWLAAFNLLLRTAQSSFTVPYWALGSELTSNYDQRTSLTAVRTACALAGTMATSVLSFVLFFKDSRFEISSYLSMGAALGAVMTGTTLLTIAGSWRWSLREQAETDSASPRASFWMDVRIALRCRSFTVLAASSGLFFLAAVLNATSAVHYLTFYAGLTDNRAASVVQGSFYVAALAGSGFWALLTKRIEKRHAFTLGTFVTAAVMALAYFLVGENRFAGLGNLAALAFGNVLAGLFASAAWILPYSMMADVLDEFEATSGRRNEGTLFGLHSLFVQMGGSGGVIASGLLLDYYAGLVPGAQIQSPETAQRIGIVFGVIPAILLAGAAAVSMLYRLDRSQVLRFQEQIKAGTREHRPDATTSSVC